MKVLYIGNFKDASGWSHAAIGNILALDAAGIDVYPKSIKLNNINGEVPQRILELEKKDAKHPDICIQHVLPDMSQWAGNISKNIIIYYTETSNFKRTGWPEKINRFDEAWVLCRQSKRASWDSGVEIPINVVPHTTDITKFRKKYEVLPFRESMKDKFIFYTIGETNRRKNLHALLKAFHTEFDPDEPVELLIKTTPSQVDLNQFCQDIKENLHLYNDISKYKKELIINEYWSDDQIMRLHESCDSFVCSSYGEAWSIPTFEAMGMGNAVICPRSTGFLDYMDDTCGWFVDTNLEPVFGMQSGIQNLYSSQEDWYSPGINYLRRSMREAYKNKNERSLRSLNGMKRVNDFSYENVGKIMKGLLEK